MSSAKPKLTKKCRMSRATKFNRNMGLGMMGLAILIFIMVFGMLYVSFRNQEDKANANENVVTGDSVTLIDYTEEDSVLHLPEKA
jgi:uncharacterized membrane protein YukC